MDNTWEKTQPFELEDEVKKFLQTLKSMKVEKKCNAYQGILEEIKKWQIFLPLIGDLRNDAMRDRHWQQIKDKVGKEFTVDSNLTLREVYNLNLNKYAEDVEEVTEQAKAEAKMEKTLKKLDETWRVVEFQFTQHKDTDIFLMKLAEEDFEMLEEN